MSDKKYTFDAGFFWTFLILGSILYSVVLINLNNALGAASAAVELQTKAIHTGVATYTASGQFRFKHPVEIAEDVNAKEALGREHAARRGEKVVGATLPAEAPTFDDGVRARTRQIIATMDAQDVGVEVRVWYKQMRDLIDMAPEASAIKYHR